MTARWLKLTLSSAFGAPKLNVGAAPAELLAVSAGVLAAVLAVGAPNEKTGGPAFPAVPAAADDDGSPLLVGADEAGVGAVKLNAGGACAGLSAADAAGAAEEAGALKLNKEGVDPLLVGAAGVSVAGEAAAGLENENVGAADIAGVVDA